MVKTGRKRLAPPVKIMIAMIAGAITGFLVGPSIGFLQPVGDIFIRLLRMVIYPLILFSIISGISQISDMTRLKKVGATFMGYWFFSSVLAAAIGLLVALLVKPGLGISMPGGEAYQIQESNIVSAFVQWVPNNPFASLAEGNLIQIIIFAMIVGLVLAGMRGTRHGDLLVSGVEACNELIMRVINWVITLAPYGVFSLIAVMTGVQGIHIMAGVGKMLLCVWLGVGAVLFFFYPLLLKFFCKLSPTRFYLNIYPMMVMAFTTCSSAATLPVTMKTAKERMGVPDDMVHMIAPPAATINMHAACLEIPIYAIFAAQVFGIEMTQSQLLLTVLMGVVTSVGSAAVPGGGIVMDAIVLELMGLPLTVIPWIVGVYYLIDMPGTMLNVTGDAVGMAAVASWLKELKRDIFNAPKSIYETVAASSGVPDSSSTPSTEDSPSAAV